MKSFVVGAVSALALSFAASAHAQTIEFDVNEPTVYLEGNIGAGLQPDSTDDRGTSLNLGVRGGVDFGPVSTELQYLNIGTNKNPLGEVDVDVFSVNANLHPWQLGAFRPYVSVGAGRTNATGSGVVDNAHTWVYNAGAGGVYELTENWSLTAEYRYYVAPDMDVATRNGKTSFKNHSLLAGVRYSF